MNDRNLIEGLTSRLNFLNTENEYLRKQNENHEKEVESLKAHNESVLALQRVVEQEKKSLDLNNKRHELETNQLISTNQSLTFANDKLKSRVTFYEVWGARIIILIAAVLAFVFYLYYRT